MISSARTSEVLLAQATSDKKIPLTKSKIRTLRVENGMMDSKNIKDTDNESVTQSSFKNLFAEAIKR